MGVERSVRLRTLGGRQAPRRLAAGSRCEEVVISGLDVGLVAPRPKLDSPLRLQGVVYSAPTHMMLILTSLVLLATPPQTPPQSPSLKATSTVEEVPTAMEDKLAPPPQPVVVTMHHAAPGEEDPETARKRLHPSVWVPATAGGVLVASGVTLYIMAKVQEGRLVDGDLTIRSDAQLRAVVNTGKRYEAISLTLLSVGGAALTTACVLFYAGLAPRAPQVSLAPLRGGAAFSFQGSF